MAIYTISCMKTRSLVTMLQTIIVTIVYAGLLNLLIVIPYESITNKKLSTEE
jgi:hypothetical protein